MLQINVPSQSKLILNVFPGWIEKECNAWEIKVIKYCTMWAQFHSAWSHDYHPPIAATQRLVTWLLSTNRSFTTLGHMVTIHQSQFHNAWSHGYHPPIETHLSPAVSVGSYFHSNCSTRFKHCGACGLFSNLFLLTFGLPRGVVHTP